MRSTLLIALLAAFASPLTAQVPYDQAGRPYVQNFDIPAASLSAAQPWTDNLTIPGWFAAFYDGLLGGYNVPESILPTSGTGRVDTAFYLYRNQPMPGATVASDAALGTQPTDQRTPDVGSGGTFHGVALVNRTGETLDTLRLTFRVELWRVAVTATTQNTLTASYRIGGESLTDGIWTLIPGAVYTTPLAGPGEGGTARSLDGNAPEHATPFDLTVRGLSLAPGQTLWLRWFDVNNRLADHGIGLDDVSVTLLP